MLSHDGSGLSIYVFPPIGTPSLLKQIRELLSGVCDYVMYDGHGGTSLFRCLVAVNGGPIATDDRGLQHGGVRPRFACQSGILDEDGLRAGEVHQQPQPLWQNATALFPSSWATKCVRPFWR